MVSMHIFSPRTLTSTTGKLSVMTPLLQKFFLPEESIRYGSYASCIVNAMYIPLLYYIMIIVIFSELLTEKMGASMSFKKWKRKSCTVIT